MLLGKAVHKWRSEQTDLGDKPQDRSHQDYGGEVICKSCHIRQINIDITSRISEERMGYITNVLGFTNFVPDGCCLMGAERLCMSQELLLVLKKKARTFQGRS